MSVNHELFFLRNLYSATNIIKLALNMNVTVDFLRNFSILIDW